MMSPLRATVACSVLLGLAAFVSASITTDDLNIIMLRRALMSGPEGEDVREEIREDQHRYGSTSLETLNEWERSNGEPETPPERGGKVAKIFKFKGYKSGGLEFVGNAANALTDSMAAIVEGTSKHSSAVSLFSGFLETIHATGFYFPAPFYALFEYYLTLMQWIDFQLQSARMKSTFIKLEYYIHKWQMITQKMTDRHFRGKSAAAIVTQYDPKDWRRAGNRVKTELMKIKKDTDKSKLAYDGHIRQDGKDRMVDGDGLPPYTDSVTHSKHVQTLIAKYNKKKLKKGELPASEAVFVNEIAKDKDLMNIGWSSVRLLPEINKDSFPDPTVKTWKGPKAKVAELEKEDDVSFLEDAVQAATPLVNAAAVPVAPVAVPAAVDAAAPVAAPPAPPAPPADVKPAASFSKQSFPSRVTNLISSVNAEKIDTYFSNVKSLTDLKLQIVTFRSYIGSGCIAGLSAYTGGTNDLNLMFEALVDELESFMKDTWGTLTEEEITSLGSMRVLTSDVYGDSIKFMTESFRGYDQYRTLTIFMEQYFGAIEYFIVAYTFAVNAGQTVPHVPQALWQSGYWKKNINFFGAPGPLAKPAPWMALAK